MPAENQSNDPGPVGILPLKSVADTAGMVEQRRAKLETLQRRIREIQAEATQLESEIGLLNAVRQHHGVSPL